MTDKVLEFIGKANDTSNFSDWGNRLDSEFNIDSPNAKEFTSRGTTQNSLYCLLRYACGKPTD